MFVLILWETTKETSVIPVKHLKKHGNTTLAKWGDTYYSAKELIRSESEEWLESLFVNTDGMVLLPDDDNLDSSILLEKRKENRDKNKTIKIARANAEQDENNRILEAQSLFDMETTSENKADVVQLSSNDDVESICERSNKTQNKEKQCLCCICSKLKFTAEDINKVIEILSIVKTVHAGQNFLNIMPVEENNKVIATKVEKVQIKKNDEIFSEESNNNKKYIPIINGSNVLVQQWKLDVFKDSFRKKPKEMVRRLMIEILGKETLMKSSPTGKNNRIPIPENVYEDVELFVRENVKRNYRLTHTEYRQCLTMLCATLRNPKSTPNKKEEQAESQKLQIGNSCKKKINQGTVSKREDEEKAVKAAYETERKQAKNKETVKERKCEENSGINVENEKIGRKRNNLEKESKNIENTSSSDESSNELKDLKKKIEVEYLLKLKELEKKKSHKKRTQISQNENSNLKKKKCN